MFNTANNCSYAFGKCCSVFLPRRRRPETPAEDSCTPCAKMLGVPMTNTIPSSTLSLKIQQPMSEKIIGRKDDAYYKLSDLDAFINHAEPGDLLEIECGGYQHWGVYAGLGYIIHFGMVTESTPEHRQRIMTKPTINKLVDIIGQNKIRINNEDDKSVWHKPAQDVDVINKRIENFISMDKPYNLISRNCEIFAKYCRYGWGASIQAGLICVVLFSIFIDVTPAVLTLVMIMTFLIVLTISVFEGILPSAVGSGLNFQSKTSKACVGVSVVVAYFVGGIGAVAFVVRVAMYIFRESLESMIGLRLRFLSSLANQIFIAGVMAAVYVVGLNSMISIFGLESTNLLINAFKMVFVLLGLYHCLYVLQLPSAAFAIVLSSVLSVVGPTFVVIGIGLPAMVYVFGISYVVMAAGPTHVAYRERDFFMVLGSVFSALLPTYLFIKVGQPALFYYLEWE